MTTPASSPGFDSTDADGLRAVLASHLPTIRAAVASVLRRRGQPGEDHSELLSDVCVHLLENDCAVLRKFRGASSLRTYLHTVTLRVLLDRRVQAWGKWRPSASARALGPDARRLEQLIKREHLTVQEALGVMVHEPGGPLDYSAAVRLYAQLRLSPRRRQVPLGELVDRVPDEHRRDPVHASDLGRRAAEISRALQRALASLPPDERRLIQLRYRDGRSLVDVARAVGSDQKHLYRRHERALTRLRSALRSAGVDAEDARTIAGEAVLNLGDLFGAVDTAA